MASPPPPLPPPPPPPPTHGITSTAAISLELAPEMPTSGRRGAVEIATYARLPTRRAVTRLPSRMTCCCSVGAAALVTFHVCATTAAKRRPPCFTCAAESTSSTPCASNASSAAKTSKALPSELSSVRERTALASAG